MKVKGPNFALVLSSLREKRATIVAWVIGGALAMYFEAIAIAAELREFPGGPQALAKSIYPTIEGLRIIRWPADRLDTLGGYLAYHNIVLFNFFLAIFAAVQGARLIRHLEENRDIEFYLATGLSRSRVVLLRSLAYFIAQITISLALGLGTAFALNVSNEPDLSGSIITLLAGGICIFPFFGLGLLMSQFLQSARTASGITSIIVTAIYVLDNISGNYAWLSWVPYISPFHYANLSRPVIPGFEASYPSWALMLAIGAILIYFSIRFLSRRDIGSVVLLQSRSNQSQRKKAVFVPKTLVGDILWRQRVGLTAWIVTTAAFIGVFISMLSSVVDIWREFSFLEQFQLSGFGATAEEQFSAMVFEILPPFIAAFIISQSSKWTSDLNEGRVQLFLSAQLSSSGLILRRITATFIGSELIILASIATALIGSYVQDVKIYPAAVGRVWVMTSLFALAFSSLSALLVALLKSRNATPAVSIYIGAAWLIVFMAPYLNWPSWVVRLSIFNAFGHPFVEWPGSLNILLIFTMTVPSLFLATAITGRSPKS